MDINIFTAAMRTEFLNSMAVQQEPAPFERVTTIVPSTARIERYPWMTPAPGISRYLGHRRRASLDQIKYTLENIEYDGTLTVPLRDVEDDIVGGYKMRMKDLTLKSRKPFQSKLIMQRLSLGASTTCFDGSNFFATSHTLGSAGNAPSGFGGGGNALTFTAAASDAVVHKFVMLVKNDILQPLLYQDRKAAKFNTDAGTPQAEKAKQADYWVDLEGVAGFGYWWDAVQMTITNTPTITELISCVDACRVTFRRFTLPKALPTDPVERVHEQTPFDNSTITIVTSTGLEQLFNHILKEDRIGVSVAGATAGITNNIYYNTFGLITTGYLDA